MDVGWPSSDKASRPLDVFRNCDFSLISSHKLPYTPQTVSFISEDTLVFGGQTEKYECMECLNYSPSREIQMILSRSRKVSVNSAGGRKHRNYGRLQSWLNLQTSGLWFVHCLEATSWKRQCKINYSLSRWENWRCWIIVIAGSFSLMFWMVKKKSTLMIQFVAILHCCNKYFSMLELRACAIFMGSSAISGEHGELSSHTIGHHQT